MSLAATQTSTKQQCKRPRNLECPCMRCTLAMTSNSSKGPTSPSMSSQSCSTPSIIPARSPRKIKREPGQASVKKLLKARDYNRPKNKKEEKQVHNYQKILTCQFRSPQKSSLQKFPPKKVWGRSLQCQWPGRRTCRTLYSQSRFLKSWGPFSRSQLQRSKL